MSDSKATARASDKDAPRLLLKNGKVLDYYPLELAADPAPRVEAVDLRMADGRIAERGPDLAPAEGEHVVDLRGAVVLPGNINAHTHLFSALASGMPLPDDPPHSFTDVLAEIWWPLDRALDAETIYLSAAAGAWDAVRCGTTLLFDHHSSLSCVKDSLDRVEQGIATVGLRGCLCYEVTDRGGKGLRDIMLEENERYLQKLRDKPQSGLPRFKGMVGAHASFTLEERTLELLAGICQRQNAGVHMHLAEGSTDREISQERGWKDPLDRLVGFGLVRPRSIFVHGVDLTPLDMQTLEERRAWLVHCGRSNMNSGVGRAPVDRFPSRCALGTDGLDDNMWGEVRTTYFRGNEGGRGPLNIPGAARFWLGGYRLAREVFEEPYGSLDTGAPADLVVLDQFQKTPLTSRTWMNHLLYDFHPWDIDSVYVGGRRVYHSGDAPPVDPDVLQEAAGRLWRAMGLETEPSREPPRA
ncbi:MAG: amidohydrolase family protein [Candidatus Krumholzibacteriia bacterium]